MFSYDLQVRYDARQSFYGKARVEERPNGVDVLISYSTEVAAVSKGKAYVNGRYSQTTTRHQKEFLKQWGFKVIDTKQMLKDYGVSDEEFEKVLRGE